jgi:hypothetical protein
LAARTAEIGRVRDTAVDVMDRLVEVSQMMYEVNRNTDVYSVEYNTKLKEEVGWIVDQSMPNASNAERLGYKKHIVDGMFTVISKAYQFDVESRIPRNNTYIVMDSKPRKRSRKGQ